MIRLTDEQFDHHLEHYYWHSLANDPDPDCEHCQAEEGSS